MELIELIKQFARRQYLVVSHYPREHLYIAGALGGLFLILLALPMGAEDDAVDGRTEIALEIDLNRSAAASDRAGGRTGPVRLRHHAGRKRSHSRAGRRDSVAKHRSKER